MNTPTTKASKTEAEWQKDVEAKIEQAKKKFFAQFNSGMDVKIHPLADSFPMMGEEEIEAISNSIMADGLRNPIVIDIDGVLIDGRNRYAALKRLNCTIREGYMADTQQASYSLVNQKTKIGDGELCIIKVIAPEYRFRSKYDEQISRFILQENMDRRHLSTSQKAALAVYIADDPKSLSQKDVIKRFAIGATILREAKKLREVDEDLFSQVVQGDITISEAIKAIKAREKENEQEEDDNDEKSPVLPEDTFKPDGNPTPEGPEPTENRDIAPDSTPDDESEEEPDVTPAPEKPTMSKEERLNILREDLQTAQMQSQYMQSVIGSIKDAAEKHEEAAKRVAPGNDIEQQPWKGAFEEIRDATFKRIWEIKDGCDYDVQRIEKVIKETMVE